MPQSNLPDETAASRLASQAEEDRNSRIEKVLERAFEVLGEREWAQKWVNSTNRSLGGVVPISLLESEDGCELVLTALARIENGIVA